MKIANRGWPLPARWRGWLCAALSGMLLWALTSPGAGNGLGTIRVYTTEPACFEYLFTGAMHDADRQALLAFNQRNGHTVFARQGEELGSYRIAAFEPKTNSVFNHSVNAWLDEPAGRVTLAGPANTTVILEQDKRLPWPGRVAWLVRLDSGAWWNIQEQDVFVMGNLTVAVEEIDEDGVTVTAGDDLQFIRLISAEEKNGLKKLWADRRRQEQHERELALQREREAAQTKETASGGGTSVVIYERGPHVEIRGPPHFFYGNEYRFPTAFKISPGIQTINGRMIQRPIVVPTGFETRSWGVSFTGP